MMKVAKVLVEPLLLLALVVVEGRNCRRVPVIRVGAGML